MGFTRHRERCYSSPRGLKSGRGPVSLQRQWSVSDVLYEVVEAGRSNFRQAYIWKQSLAETPVIPDYSEWGLEWSIRNKRWTPYWTGVDDISKACSLLLHCGCVVSCKENCKCTRVGPCSPLCKYEGACANNDSE